MNAPLQRTRHEFSRKHNITNVPPKFRFPFPGVYIFWSNNGRALYVGCSLNVWKRANKQGNHRARTRAFAEADFIEICKCDSLKQALHLETELIGLYKPKY